MTTTTPASPPEPPGATFLWLNWWLGVTILGLFGTCGCGGPILTITIFVISYRRMREMNRYETQYGIEPPKRDSVVRGLCISAVLVVLSLITPTIALL